MVLGLIGLMTTSLVNASGPGIYGGNEGFEDVYYRDGDGSVSNDHPWFADALMSMYSWGIVEGYADSTFRPNNSVNRAELVTMLDRFYNRFIQRDYKEWQTYANSQYSVWTPVLGDSSRVQSDDGCSSYIQVPHDVMFPVSCFDGGNSAMEKRIADSGSQFAEDSRRRESRWTFTLNGRTATRVVVTAFGMPDWYSESIYIVDEQSGKGYELSNGAIKDPNFEHFYLSFMLR